jgi:hypothetical protein
MVAEEDTEEVVHLDDDDDNDDQPIEVTKHLEGVNRTLDASILVILSSVFSS